MAIRAFGTWAGWTATFQPSEFVSRMAAVPGGSSWRGLSVRDHVRLRQLDKAIPQGDRAALALFPWERSGMHAIRYHTTPAGRFALAAGRWSSDLGRALDWAQHTANATRLTL